MHKDNLVSVIIPTYKNRGSLQRSIDSALAQTYDNIEIIVVDDNEPNTQHRRDTELILSQYGDNEKVIYIKHEHNKNGSAARNTGWRNSHGLFVTFLDDDDQYLPDKVYKELKYLEEHKEFDAAYTFEESEDHIVIDITPYEGDVSKEILLLQSHIQTSTIMFRRYALDRINGFDESYKRHQDLEILLRFFQAGMKIGCLQESLVIYGYNMGENAMVGKQMEDLKEHFLSQFGGYIEKYDKETPGFANKVYSKHYAAVFLKYIKNKNFLSALRVFICYFFKSPKTFLEVVNYSIKAHL